MKIGEVGGRRWDSRKEEKVEKIGEKDSAQKKTIQELRKRGKQSAGRKHRPTWKWGTCENEKGARAVQWRRRGTVE